MAANSSLLLYPTSSGSSVMLIMSITFIVVKAAVFLPPSLLVLRLGLRRWRRRSSAPCSHADVFSFHSAAVELLYMLGASANLCGSFLGASQLILLGLLLCLVAPLIVTCLNILTCVERYLAIVHPVLYLGSRQAAGVRIRNASIGCVWLLCPAWVAGVCFYTTVPPFASYFCFLALSLVLVSFCSLSVLRVLVRRGPGDVGRGRAPADQSKRRAFRTIIAILGALLLCFLGCLVTVAVANSRVSAGADTSVVLMSGYWWSLPSTLILPVLFLQRAGKPLLCLIKSNQ